MQEATKQLKNHNYRTFNINVLCRPAFVMITPLDMSHDVRNEFTLKSKLRVYSVNNRQKETRPHIFYDP